MKRIIITGFCIFFLSASTLAQISTYTGEELNYKISYSIFTIGKASVKVEDRQEKEEEYKIVARGETTGLVGVFSKIRDEWGAYVNKQSLAPSHAYRRIREGKYKRDEDVDFDSTKIVLNEWSFRAGKYKDPVYYDAPNRVFEFLSGMLYVRSLDLRNFEPGQRVAFKAFFEGKFYDFQVEYKGKERIRTKIGKINAIKLVPIMPNNSIFDGEDSVEIWVSDDENKVPLKVEADMFIGSAGCSITSAKNLKYPLNRS
ncbi:MAG: DUF3108 domain-containing protein [Bacteroidota bacterium]